MRLSPADIRGLVVFRTIVEHGGFTGAQLSLGMSQSTVSFHLKSLEERVGFKLCRRGRKGFQLTERGREVYEASKMLASAVSGFESRLGDLRHQIVGTLRIGIVDNTITDPNMRLHEAVESCLNQADELEIQIMVAPPEVLIAELAKGGIDLAITPEIEIVEGFKAHPIHTETHSLYCGDRHPLFPQAASARSGDVERCAFVVRPYTNNKELQHFPKAKVRSHASNMEAQAMFILTGRLIGYLPDHFAQSWVEEGLLRPLLSPHTRIVSQFTVLTNETEQSLHLVQMFIAELVSRTVEGKGSAVLQPRSDASRKLV